MAFFYLTQKQLHPPETAIKVICAEARVDPCRIHARVTQQIGQMDDVAGLLVEGERKQVTQIMREDLFRRDARCAAEPLHLPPDVTAVERIAGRGQKHRSAYDLPQMTVVFQLFAEPPVHQDDPRFALIVNLRAALFQALRCNILQFADPDSGAADRLHHQKQLPVLFLRCPQQLQVFLVRQCAEIIAKSLPLDPQQPHPQITASDESKEAVHRDQHRIHTRSRVVLFQRLFI